MREDEKKQGSAGIVILYYLCKTENIIVFAGISGQYIDEKDLSECWVFTEDSAGAKGRWTIRRRNHHGRIEFFV